MKFTLKQAREYSGISQVDMAGKLGMTESTYIQYEKYRRVFRMNTAFDFSRVTAIPIDQIIFFEKQLQKNCSN